MLRCCLRHTFVKYGLRDDWEFLNITTEGYGKLEEQYHLLFAASIWILDRLTEAKVSFKELYKLLPTDPNEVFDALYLPEIWDSSYEPDFISSVEYVLHFRNADIAPLESDGGDGERVFTSILSAEGKDRADVPGRKRFEQLLSLIPQEMIEGAVNNFTDHYAAWCDRFFNCIKSFGEKNSELFDKLNMLNEQVRESEKKGESTLRQLQQLDKHKPKKQAKTPFAVTGGTLPDLDNNSLLDRLDQIESLHSQMQAIIAKNEELSKQYNIVVGELKELEHKKNLFSHYIRSVGYIDKVLPLRNYGTKMLNSTDTILLLILSKVLKNAEISLLFNSFHILTFGSERIQ